MGTFINKGNAAFRSARAGEYVDKSGMISIINATLGKESRYTCVTRCRRFGKMKKRLSLILLSVLVAACGNNREAQPVAADDHGGSTSTYGVLMHYWDSFPYDDDTAMMQRVMVDWLQMLSQLPEVMAQASARMAVTAGHGCPDGQVALFGWLETMLNNPNSPYRNEELFIPILEALTQDTLLSYADKARPRYLLTQALKNRKGTRAADIVFIAADGSRRRLYDIHCEQILLYFFNPDCHDCKRVSNLLQNDPQLRNLQRQGRLQVVAIYPDEDLTSWDHRADDYPAAWIVGRAPTKHERYRYHLPNLQEAYHLPAIPSIYMLDSAYTVRVKDASLR